MLPQTPMKPMKILPQCAILHLTRISSSSLSGGDQTGASADGKDLTLGHISPDAEKHLRMLKQTRFHSSLPLQPLMISLPWKIPRVWPDENIDDPKVHITYDIHVYEMLPGSGATAQKDHRAKTAENV